MMSAHRKIIKLSTFGGCRLQGGGVIQTGGEGWKPENSFSQEGGQIDVERAKGGRQIVPSLYEETGRRGCKQINGNNNGRGLPDINCLFFVTGEMVGYIFVQKSPTVGVEIP